MKPVVTNASEHLEETIAHCCFALRYPHAWGAGEPSDNPDAQGNISSGK